MSGIGSARDDELNGCPSSCATVSREVRNGIALVCCGALESRAGFVSGPSEMGEARFWRPDITEQARYAGVWLYLTSSQEWMAALASHFIDAFYSGAGQSPCVFDFRPS